MRAYLALRPTSRPIEPRESRWLANRNSPSPCSGERRLERETGIEPATNCLEGCDSTTELLPPSSSPDSPHSDYGGQARQLSPENSRQRSAARREGKVGGEGRVRTSVATRAAGLQPAAIDRSATSPIFLSTRRTCESTSTRAASGRRYVNSSGCALEFVYSTRSEDPSTRPSLVISTPPSTDCVAPIALPVHPVSGPVRWSWRRDSNPRPADYKSAALPD